MPLSTYPHATEINGNLPGRFYRPFFCIKQEKKLRYALLGLFSETVVVIMKLYLVQHGEACDESVDPARPLTDTGKADVNHLAVFMRKNNIQVEQVIHSGKLRAAQTVERLLNSVAAGTVPEVSDKVTPNADVADFVDLSFSWNRDTLIVSHLPFLARLVSQLCVRDTGTLFANFAPGSALCLQRNEQNQWKINWMVRPDTLR